MGSDEIEQFVDNNGDNCSSNSCSDDLHENQVKESSAGHNLQVDQVKDPNTGHNLQEDQVKEPNAGHSLQEDQVKEPNAGHSLQEDQVKEPNAGHEGATELKSIIELSPDDILKMEFDSHEKAYEFYVKYARCVGFGVRKADVARDDDGNMVRRKFVCNKAGLRDKKHYSRVDRKREHKPETRTKCSARLNVCLTKTSTWKVSKFEVAHNHELTPLKFVHLIPSHRRPTDADKAQSDGMYEYGIQTSQIMGFVIGQTGGYTGVERQSHAKLTDGNALAAISYLQGKADFDPMMVVRYTIIDGDRLGNLFWLDGLSRVDYGYFGDVVAIDSTYKKNKFNKPLVLFSGTNHHRQTCLFACALLVDEEIDTYKWVLENFLDTMQKKQPNVVVADNDEAMREAIKVVFPNATYRQCASHLKVSAASHIKDSEFFETFKKCIYHNFDLDDFEQYWHNMIQKFKLYDNKWVEKTYKMKDMWANAYLRDKLYSGVRTTSRCEGINLSIKRFIKSSDNILELVQHLEHAMKEYRNNEFVAEFNSMYSEPVLTTALESIERGAANVYTREIFKEVREEIQGAAALFSVGCENIATTVMYKLNKYCEPGHEYKVTYDKNSATFDCQCRLLNTHGIPCSHIFCVMRQEHIGELPENMILKRWTKTAKSYDEPPQEEEDSNKMFLLRYGALCAASNWMSFLAAKNLQDYLETRDEICRVTTKLEHKCQMVDTGSSSVPKNKVDHPVMVKTKDVQPNCKNVKEKRRCSNCKEEGHMKRQCPGVKDGKSQLREDDLNSSSTSDDPLGLAPLNVIPVTNNKGVHNLIDSSPSMMQLHAVKQAATTSGIGIKESQFNPPGQTQPFYVGSHFNQFHPPLFYSSQPDFIRPQGPMPQFIPQGVAQQWFAGGPSHQQPDLAQHQNAANHSHQLPLQNMLGNPSMRNQKNRR